MAEIQELTAGEHIGERDIAKDRIREACGRRKIVGNIESLFIEFDQKELSGELNEFDFLVDCHFKM